MVIFLKKKIIFSNVLIERHCSRVDQGRNVTTQLDSVGGWI